MAASSNGSNKKWKTARGENSVDSQVELLLVPPHTRGCEQNPSQPNKKHSSWERASRWATQQEEMVFAHLPSSSPQGAQPRNFD
mmetsp:Transcript_5329/g.16808  ORF Transcript_5329/g.16808 Transcript_5329/m.16808 type:complete len:84 (+) Transcript_5329:378-629(+)